MRLRSLLVSAAVVAGLLTIPVTEAVAPQASAAPAQVTQALRTLNTLPVKGRAPKTGYSRAMFGQSWSDEVSVAGGRNGCDTRNDILRRDLVNKTYKPGTRRCVVASGTLNDPYTGNTIRFVRGPQSGRVQIDHVVALSDAWQKGAQYWLPWKRQDFANNPLNLQAVSGSANQRKGAGDAATWLPPNKAYRCTYVAKQIRVKRKYGLWVTAAEKSAMRRVLTNCNGTVTRPAPARPRPQQNDVYFRNCSEARAAGAAPIRRGQPGYRPPLDRDNDGIACE